MASACFNHSFLSFRIFIASHKPDNTSQVEASGRETCAKRRSNDKRASYCTARAAECKTGSVDRAVEGAGSSTATGWDMKITHNND